MFVRERGEETFSVASFESDFTGRLSVHSLFHRFQDLAGRHASVLQVGFEKLKEAGLAWLLSRIKVQILRLPEWGEKVTLQTWPKGVDRLFALRDFRLIDMQGRVLALATTCWLLVDMEKGKPRRVESLGLDLTFPGAEHAVKEIPDKIPVPGALRPAYVRQILPSDIDVNDHVNNAHYARWVTDCYDLARLRSGIKGLQLNYLGQSLIGDTIAIAVSADGSLPKTDYVEGTNTSNGEKVFQALVEW